MIEVKVFGGLGNQMFQYAMYEYLKLNNDNVIMNISDYKIHNHHNGFELEDVFGIVGPYNKNRCEFSVNSNSIFIRMVQKMLRARISYDTEYYEHKELSFINSRINTNAFLIGFWQDVRYIKPIEDKLKKKFKFREVDSKNKKFLEKISSRNTVSIHVRRGDYLLSDLLSSICNTDYYRRAIEVINKYVDNPLYIFFSDDPNWCKNEFSDLDAVFVDWNIGEDSYIDMYLMSKCNHNIIANSTFSWWGAFLNNNPNKIVICPEKWNLKHNLNQLAFDGWKCL